MERAALLDDQLSIAVVGRLHQSAGRNFEIHELHANDANTVESQTRNILYVLEVSKGWFDRHHIATGTSVRTERGIFAGDISPAKPVKIALAQINTTVGDLAGNEAKILDNAARARSEGVDLVLFPELSITGYPPRDLLLKKDFIAGNLAALQRLAAASGPAGLLVGFVGENKNLPGPRCHQRCRLVAKWKDRGHARQDSLPTYDVFDEDRYFEPAQITRPSPSRTKYAG